MFDTSKPTTQMLGRWQPWHAGHTELFKRAYAETGQVVIMVRTVFGYIGQDAGAGRTVVQDDNPFNFQDVVYGIKSGLSKAGFFINQDYMIMQVPNIVDISYGRGVGYTFTEHDLGKEVHDISATKIREQMRKEGKL